ncbi:hypothetical protein ACUNWD_05220 [Sunxiuqinia sp. A32]|uniref:hypothetical protein n=1 Tax=Sunxiuqinia sp. A32 TaxID=3461496 RepID=UPI0040456111
MMLIGMNWKLITLGILLLLIIAMGVVIYKTGKPYNHFSFAVQKLGIVAFVVIATGILINFGKNSCIHTTLWVLITTSGVSMVTILFSGALLSLDKLQKSMQIAHKISSFTFLLFIIGTFFLVYKSQIGY